jgi:hypothetical protein
LLREPVVLTLPSSLSRLCATAIDECGC